MPSEQENYAGLWHESEIFLGSCSVSPPVRPCRSDCLVESAILPGRQPLPVLATTVIVEGSSDWVAIVNGAFIALDVAA